MTRTVKNGDKIRVNYTGTLTTGEVFDTSLREGRTPLEFAVGAGMMIKGFDKGVVGMAVGETRTLRLPPEEAYGARRDDMMFVVDKSRMPRGYTPKKGDVLSMGPHRVVVAEVNDDGSVVIDANHELAGKELIFEVTLVEIL